MITFTLFFHSFLFLFFSLLYFLSFFFFLFLAKESVKQTNKENLVFLDSFRFPQQLAWWKEVESLRFPSSLSTSDHTSFWSRNRNGWHTQSMILDVKWSENHRIRYWGAWGLTISCRDFGYIIIRASTLDIRRCHCAKCFFPTWVAKD